MTYPHVEDPFVSADEAKPQPSRWWGEVQVDAQYVVLEKGVGKVPFDPQQHSLDRRVTAVFISILPLDAHQANFPLERNMIAEFPEWTKIVLPSLKALNVTLRELNGCHACVEVVPTGRTYQSNGETREATTFKFVKLFENYEECTINYHRRFEAAEEAPASATEQAPVADNGDGGGKEKQAMLGFLRVIVRNAAQGQTDLAVVRESVAANIAGFPVVSKYFTVDSPETAQLILEEMAPF